MDVWQWWHVYHQDWMDNCHGRDVVIDCHQRCLVLYFLWVFDVLDLVPVDAFVELVALLW